MYLVNIWSACVSNVNRLPIFGVVNARQASVWQYLWNVTETVTERITQYDNIVESDFRRSTSYNIV